MNSTPTKVALVTGAGTGIGKAAAKALQKHPLMNSQFGGTGIQLLNEIHVGIAVALPEGLVVPVVRHADQLSLK